MGIQRLLDEAIDKGLELQIKFKDDPTPVPLGPGKVERITGTVLGVRMGLHGLEPDGTQATETLGYRMLVPAELGTPNGRRSKMILPIIFDVGNVLWFSEGPLTEDGKAAIVVPTDKREAHPGNANRTEGGLHIPPGARG